jgi:homocysteine S-methyltransferase
VAVGGADVRRRNLGGVDGDVARRLTDDAVVRLDGGLATTLAAAGHDLDHPLWSARLLTTAPDAVVDAHRAFLAAGAEVVLTASYQLARTSLRRAGEDPEREADLLARSVALARDAVAAHVAAGGAWAAVVGSVGSYGALIGGGAEYEGGYDVDVGVLVDVHAPRVAALVAAGVDAIAVETVPSATELDAVARVIDGLDVPVWVTATTDVTGTRTPEGDRLEVAFAPLVAVDTVVAVGVNCLPPERVAPALAALAPLGRPLVAKPNAGERFDPDRGRFVATVEVPDPGPWVAAGARLVGGCCGTSPTQLATLLAHLP